MNRQVVLIAVLVVLAVAVVVRFSSTSANDQIDTPRSAPAPADLERVALDKAASTDDRLGALAHLAASGEQGMQVVREVLHDPTIHPAIKSQCLLVLSDVSDYQSLDTMIDSLSDDSKQVRGAANSAVARMFGGLKVKVQTQPGAPSEDDLATQQRYYRNLWIVMQKSPNFDEFKAFRKGEQHE